MAPKFFLHSCLFGIAVLSLIPSPALAKSATESSRAKAHEIQHHTGIDHSGKRQRGKGSYYSRKFSGKKMANGTPMNPNANVAASRTLPLGTKARVKNLRTGKSTVVNIEDRGPYAKDRIIDLSPKAAKQVDMDKTGVAPVEVAPIQIPQSGGNVKPGTAAQDEGSARPRPRQ